METISFIILHYMVLEETIQCIHSIKRMDNQERIKVVVVDNASPNGSGKKLEQIYCGDEQVDIIINATNEGFSRGNNLGYYYAKKKWNPDFFVVTNNDILFLQKDFLQKVRDEYTRSEFSVLGIDIYCEKKGIHQSPLANKIPNVFENRKTIFLNTIVLNAFDLFYPFMKLFFSKIDTKGKDALGYDKYQKNVCLMGACLIFSKKYADERKILFFPETDFYYEEFLLTQWCLNNNGVIVYQPEIKVLHNEGVATGQINVDYKERIKFRMSNILKSAKIYQKELIINKRK